MSEKERHINPDQYARYLKGELSNDEAYEVERILQSSPLYDEAMDGLEMLSQEELTEDLHSLRDKIPLPKAQRKHPAWRQMAAAVSMLLISVTTIWLLLPENEKITKQELGLAEKKKSTLDTNTSNEDTSEESVILEAPVEEEEMTDQSEFTQRVDLKTSSSEKQLENQPIAKKIGSGESQALSDKGNNELALVKEEEELMVESLEIDDADDIAMDSFEALEEVQLDDKAGEGDITEPSSILSNGRISERRAARPAAASSLVPDSSTQLDQEFFKLDSIQYVEKKEAAAAARNLEKRAKLKDSKGVQPKPVGGERKFNQYLLQNSIRQTSKKNYKGVLLKMQVNDNGTLGNIQVIGGDTVIGNSVIPVLLNGPKWIPSTDSSKNQLIRKFFKKSKKK